MSTIQWHIRDNYEYLEQFLQHDEWTQRVELVKRNQRRSVYRLKVPTRDDVIFIKHDHPKSLRNRVKSLWRYKEKDEYKTALELQRRGVSTVPLIGWGSRNPDSFLVTGTIPGTECFTDVWEECRCLPEIRQRFLVNLVSFLQSMANGGVVHFDFHPANILVSTCRESDWFFLVDFSNIKFVSMASLRQRFRLIQWLEGMLTGLSSKEQLMILNSVGLCPSAAQLNPARQAIVRYNQEKEYRMWPGRQHYFLRQSKRCDVIKSSLGKWRVVRPFDHNLALRVLNATVPMGGEKDLPGKSAQPSVSVTVDSQGYLITKFDNKTGLFFRSYDRKFWLTAHRLTHHGIPVARVFAWLRTVEGHGYVIMEAPGENDLFSELNNADFAYKRRLLLNLARVLARIQNLRIQFQLLNTHNIFVKSEQKQRPRLIITTDDKTVKFGVVMTIESRVASLAQVFETFPSTLDKVNKLRFLAAYRRSTFISKEECREIVRRLS